VATNREAYSTLKRAKIAKRNRRLVGDVFDQDGKLKEPVRNGG
jgi:hypothetical protein